MPEKDTSIIRKELCKDRVATGTHNYFFEVKEANNGSRYVVIEQIRRQADRKGEKVKMRIFQDELLEFRRVLQKMIRFALNEEQPANVVANIQPNYQESPDSELSPSFFNKLLSTHEWKEFERYTYYLLKLLGIQTAYKFLDEQQAGKADGFFKFGNLAVIYDCTLDNQGVEERKREQIINYCNRLKQGSIELSGATTVEFQNHQKQVWIITRGTSRRIKLVNDIEVKEVSIQDIMSLYQERLKNAVSDQLLEIKMRNL